MARAHTGSIDQISPGRWRVRVTIFGKRTVFGTYTSEAEARVFLELANEELAKQAKEVPAPDNTFGACAQRWLDARAKSKHVTNPLEEQWRFGAYVERDPIASVPIHLVSRAHVIEWVERVRSRVRASTTRNALQIVRGTLTRAYNTGRIKTNPAVGVQVQRDAIKTERIHIDLEQQTALVQAAGEYWPLVAFAMGTGLRSGEQCALRMRDVDAKSGRITVSRGAPNGRQTKTKKARDVFAMGPAVQALEHQLAARTGAALDEPLFPTKAGGFRQPKQILRGSTWKAIVQRAGLPRGF